MDREELKAQIDELMRRYENGEIDGATYSQTMMELTSSAQAGDSARKSRGAQPLQH